MDLHVPFTGKKEDEQQPLSQDGFDRLFPPPVQQSQEDKGQQGNYYVRVQVETFDEEVALLRATLEGKIEALDENGKKCYVYPTLIIRMHQVRYMKGEEEKLGYISEQQFNQKTMIPTGKYTDEEIEVKEPFCSTMGIREILGFAAQRLKPGTILSNYSSDTAMERTRIDAHNLNNMIYLNMTNWKVDSTRHQAMVLTIADRIESARRRAIGNLEREGTWKSNTVSTLLQPIAKAAGGLPFIGNMGKSNPDQRL